MIASRVSLKKICKKVCSGGTPKSTIGEYYGGDIPWLNTKEINFNRIYATEKTITELGMKNSSAKWIFPNTIVIAMYGATAGKIAIAKKKMTTNQACCNLTIDEKSADYLYVYYVLQQHYRELSSLANGGAQQNLNAQIIQDFEINLPSLEIQKKIGALLSSLDDKIELNTQINHNLEEQAKAIFKSWFVDFEPFQNGKFVDSELGKIPKGWKITDLETIANVVTGKRPLKKKNTIDMQYSIPVIGASSIMAYTVESLYSEKILIIGRVGTHGIVQRFENECWPSDNTLVITSDYYEFVSIVLQNIDYKKLNRGSTQPLITQTDIKKTKIIRPEEKTLLAFEQCVGILMKQWTNNLYENQKLAQLRDTLLPKLMSGEIDVSEVTI